MNKRDDWSAWRMDEEDVRVQVNCPGLAKAFAKEKGVRLAGYSVAGNYVKLFHVKKPREWVDSWMKKSLRESKMN